ncbi:MAG: DUF1887 family protein [Clostridia bacterium]|nr:DUF1887 family protein [Clostridia bacterium]
MTAIEFCDRAPIENVISTLTTAPDKIIFVGEGKAAKRFFNAHKAYIEDKKLGITIDFKSIKKNDLSSIVETLSDIVEKEDSCVFDLTGGEDLALVAMGIVYEKYSHKDIQLQRFIIENGVVTDCDNDQRVIYSGAPLLSVDDHILIHGGAVRYKKDEMVKTVRWELTDDFVKTVKFLWEIARKDPQKWNNQSAVLAYLNNYASDNEPLSISVDLAEVEAKFEGFTTKYVDVKPLLKLLFENDVISEYSHKGSVISFSYKDGLTAKCIKTAGAMLELKVLVTAAELKDENGKPYYNDALSGVFIDWDGAFHGARDEKADTENEIDVVLMKGLVPVFISCKNGKFEEEELYKLDAVASRFGGKYVKKVLIATDLGSLSDKTKEALSQRAVDMDISILRGVHKIDDDSKFAEMLRSLTGKGTRAQMIEF